MPPRNLTFILITAMVSFACYLKAERNRYASQLSEAMNVVSELYLEEVEPRKLFENAMSGMLEGLDQYSSYIGPDVFKQMEQSLDQEFGGVGIEVEKLSDDHPIIVLSPLFDSPGYRAGLRSGDRILAIDGERTIGMKRKDAVTKMRGKPGTKVHLVVQHVGSDEEVEITVERAVILVDSLLGDVRRPDGTWDFHLQEDPRIGYLRLTSFGKHSVEELKGALGNGGPCPFEAIILDLRNNAGGLLDAAVDTCRLFIDRGRIVSTRGRDGQDRSVYEANGTAIIPRSIPMVVLVNRYSASASEIVAACLQDHRRAIVVGERTWGKGTVQNLFALEGGRSALKLTTASYWRPSGKNIHRSNEDLPDPQLATTPGKDAEEKSIDEGQKGDRGTEKNGKEDGQQDDSGNPDWGVKPSPGFEVKLTDEELEKVLRARRERDLQHAPKQALDAALSKEQPELPKLPPENEPQDQEPSASSPESGAEKGESESAGEITEPFEDPQLRKAIDYLKQQLGK